MPIKKLESESATWATVVCRSVAIAGKPGRYMSIEKGPIAESIPNITIIKNLFFLFMACSINKTMSV